MKKRYWTASAAALGLLAGVGLPLAGYYDIGADDRHWPLTETLLEMVRENAVSRQAATVETPPTLNDETRIRQGAGNYATMCSSCHLAPGVDTSELYAGLYPAPPALARTGISDEKKTFWAIKHGFKMTGMPAWGSSHSDEDIWSLVAFLKRLPDLTESEYTALVADSGGHSHTGGHAEASHADSHGAPDEHHGNGSADIASDGHGHAH